VRLVLKAVKGVCQMPPKRPAGGSPCRSGLGAASPFTHL
jgi:hypothetical protein